MYQSTECSDVEVELWHAISIQFSFHFFVAFSNSDVVLINADIIERRTDVSVARLSLENEAQVKAVDKISESTR